MLKSEAAAYLAGITSDDEAQAEAPTNLHILTGEVVSTSEDGLVKVAIDGLMFSEEDEQSVEIETMGGLEEGDIATILLSGENGRGMSPFSIGAPGSIDRIVTHILETDELVADKATITDLEAAEARIGTLETDKADITDLTAATGRITNLESSKADITSLDAATARIGTLEATDITVNNRLTAAEAVINTLDANYAQIDMANVNNAWINNGTVKDGAISNAMINSVSANKLTAGTIDASNITVTNLNADNITTGTINGQRIGVGSLSLDKLAEDVYTESEVDGIVSNLQTQIDGAIETWTGTVVPTLQNSPASGWTTNAIKDTHVGDVYFVVNSQSQQNGYNYRFTKSGNTYSWELIKDSDVTNALQRITTAEGQITQFDSDISQLQTDTGSLTTRTTSLEGRMNTAEGEIDLKVDTSTFNSLSSTVDGNSASITSLSTVLTNNGLTSSTNISNTVNTVFQTATTNSSKISNLTTTLGTNTDGTTKSTDVVHKVSSVEQDLNGFKTTVSSTYATVSDVGDLEDRVETAESNITQNANNIELKVSESTVTGDYLVGKINLNSTTATIAAERVNIAGAALFTGNGRLSQTSLDNAYDANGAAATAQSNAISTAAADATAKANAANAKEQLIYISAQSGTSSMNETTTWVTDATGAQATWTTKRPQYNSSYPVLFVATQRQTVGGTVACTTPVIDDTLTVIDGGNIITGSVTANKLNAANINASGMLSVGALDSAANAEIDDAAKTATNYIYADSSGIVIADSNPDTATTYQHQTATETEFVVSGDSVAEIGGSGIRLGKTNEIHLEGDSSGVSVYEGTSPKITMNTSFADGNYRGGRIVFNDDATNASVDIAGLARSGSAYLDLNALRYSSNQGYGPVIQLINDSISNLLRLSNLTTSGTGSFIDIGPSSIDVSTSALSANATTTINSHSLVTTTDSISSGVTLSEDTGGTGAYFKEDSPTASNNIGYIRSFGRSGSSRLRGLQIGGHNIDDTNWNMLYLLTDKDGNRVVQVSEQAPWRTALGLGSTATMSTIPIANGGTGKTSRADALVALGGAYGAGDSFSGTINCGGFVTNSGKNYCFTIPLVKGIEGTLTLSSMTLVVRQDNKYVIGSASSATDVKSQATVTRAAHGLGIVVALSSAPSNVTNNSSVGVACAYSFSVS